MPKKLLFNTSAQKKVLKGAEIVCRAVGSTLGPKAWNVAIERPWGQPVVLHDGVSIARDIDLEDQFENIGAQLIKEAAQKTNDIGGDGTTTATILTYSILKEALKNISAGANAMMLRKGIEIAKGNLLKELEKLSQKVKTDEEIRQIATVSAQNDEIGDLIYKAIKKLGRDCTITVEESGTNMSLEYKEGLEFRNGYQSPYFITNPNTMEAEVKDPIILISDFSIDTMPDFVKFLQNWDQMPSDQKSGNNMVIICGEITGRPLATLIANRIKGNLNINVVKAPGPKEKTRDLLEDIAVVTGGKVVSAEVGDKLAELDPSVWGRASSVVSDKDNTTIIDGFGLKSRIKKHVVALKERLDKVESEFEKEELKERIAKLTSGIAVIGVGANSEPEIKEKKERCIDAINATQAAIEEGIVPGGEVALLYAIKRLEEPKLEGDELIGYNLILKAIQEPFRILMTNSGYDPGQMLERFNRWTSMGDKTNKGIDVLDGQIKDMIKAGIIDPVKVTRCALENSVSSAIMLFTTNSLITNIKEDNPQQQGMM
jgi:chaperonin GroEL